MQEIDQVIDGRYMYKKSKLLGKGQFGSVYKGIDIQMNREVAIKVIDIQDQQDIIQDAQQREIPSLVQIEEQMDKLKIENIVKLYGHKMSLNKVILVMELCRDGDLKNYRNQRGGQIPEQEAKKIFKDLVNGLYLLSCSKVVHRDLKPQNILFEKCWKIADFGFANFIKDGNFFQSIKGTPQYMAPQILNGVLPPFEVELYTNKCDVFSLGIVIYELLYGITPWKAQSPRELIDIMKQKPLQFPNNIQVSSQLKDILINMLHFSEQQRISIEQLYNSSYFEETQDIYSSNQIDNNQINELDQYTQDLNQHSIRIINGQPLQTNNVGPFQQNPQEDPIQFIDVNKNILFSYNQQRTKELAGIQNKLQTEKNKIAYLLQIYTSLFFQYVQDIGLTKDQFYLFLCKYSFLLAARIRCDTFLNLFQSMDPTIFINSSYKVCSENTLNYYWSTQESQTELNGLCALQHSIIQQQRKYVQEYNQLQQNYPQQFYANKWIQLLPPQQLISNVVSREYDILAFFTAQFNSMRGYIKNNFETLKTKKNCLIWCYHLLNLSSRLSDIFKDQPELNFYFNSREFYDKVSSNDINTLCEIVKRKLRN